MYAQKFIHVFVHLPSGLGPLSCPPPCPFVLAICCCWGCKDCCCFFALAPPSFSFMEERAGISPAAGSTSLPPNSPAAMGCREFKRAILAYLNMKAS